MKLYRLFYDDTTDLNGEKIEIGFVAKFSQFWLCNYINN